MQPDPRRALLVSLLALVAALPPAAAGPPVVPRLPGKVKLDGRLDEPQWRKALRISEASFSRWVADRYTIDPDEFALRMFHDGRHLFVSLASYDRWVQPGEPPDSADGLYAFSLVAGGGPIQHYRLRWSSNPPQAGGQMIDHGRWGARLRGPYAVPAQPGGGYVLEFSIPLKAAGWKPGGNARINVIVNDHDGKPGAPYNDPAVQFARFALGSLDNDDTARYFTFKLAP